MKRKRTYVGLLMAALLVVVGCDRPDARPDGNGSASEPNAISQHETPIERIARERKWVADKAMEKARQLVNEANRELAKINGKTFVDERELKRVVIFVPEPKPQQQRGQREQGDEDSHDDGGWGEVDWDLTITALPDPSAWSRSQDGPPQVELPDDAFVKQWSDHVAEAQSIKARYRLGKLEELKRTDSLDYPFRVVVSAEAIWTHRRGLAKDIHPVPEPPNGKQRFAPGRRPTGKFLGSGRRRGYRLPVPSPAGRACDPNSDLQRKALQSMQQGDPDSDTVRVRLTFTYRIADKRWIVVDEDFNRKTELTGGDWATAQGGVWDSVRSPWPACSQVSWKTGLPEDADHILRPEDVRLPEESQGS
jgi:hypothetical protein